MRAGRIPLDDSRLTLRFAIMTVSLLLVVASAVAVSLKEKSWINWYSLLALQTVGMLYVLPALFMLTFGASGSLYAYAYCFTTYAMVSLSGAAGYCFLAPLQLKRSPPCDNHNRGALPWLLLLSGLLLYVPVLNTFRNDIFQPREIYAGFSAAGYGLNFFGSTMLVTLAFLLYLFKPRKSPAAAVLFVVASAFLIYLHGSKGQLIVLGFAGVLHRVYAGHKRASLARAATVVLSTIIGASLLFAVFGSASNIAELAMDMANYSDAGRNAMSVVDDARLSYYGGQLELEDEFYSRMPRLVVPNKPRAFGQVRLAQRYYPELFRNSAGTPSFGIGMQYADFGAISMLFLSACGLATGWMARSLVVGMKSRPTPGRFLLLLFFAGVSIVPLGAGYLLPETFLLAAAVDWFQGVSFTLIKLRPSAAVEAIGQSPDPVEWRLT